MPDIIDRRTAHRLNLRRFYTGKPCKQGHVCERYVANGSCVECLNMSPAPGPSELRHSNVRNIPVVFSYPMPSREELVALTNWLPAIVEAQRQKWAAEGGPIFVPVDLNKLSPEQVEFARVENAYDEIEHIWGRATADHFKPWLERGWTLAQLKEHGHLQPPPVPLPIINPT